MARHAPQHDHDTTPYEPNSLHGTMKSRMVAEHAVPQIYILKSCPGGDVNASVAYVDKHPELWFDGNNSKRAVVSAFVNPDSWLK